MRRADLLILRRATVLPLAIALAMFLASCTSLGSVTPPELTITNLSIVEMTALETTARLTVRITNPNPDPLHVTGGSFALKLQGVKVGTAVSNEELQLDRLSTVTEDVDLMINHLVALTRLRPILRTNTVEYELNAKLYTTGSFGTKRIKIGSSGSLDLPASWGNSLDSLAPGTVPPTN